MSFQEPEPETQHIQHTHTLTQPRQTHAHGTFNSIGLHLRRRLVQFGRTVLVKTHDCKGIHSRFNLNKNFHFGFFSCRGFASPIVTASAASSKRREEVVLLFLYFDNGVFLCFNSSSVSSIPSIRDRIFMNTFFLHLYLFLAEKLLCFSCCLGYVPFSMRLACD